MRRGVMLAAGLGVLVTVSTALTQPGGFPGGGPPGGFPGGPFEPPRPGQVLPGPVQEQLKLSAAQKKRLADLQKEVDAKLAELLTAEQKKSLQEARLPGFGPGGFGPGRFGPGGGGPGGAGPGGFGPPGGGAPQRFGGRFGTDGLDDVKKKLGATDEEWKVIGPKLQKVISARQVLTSETSGADAGGPGRGPVGFGGPWGTSVLGQARAELRTVVDAPKHTKAEVEEKVAAVRKARQQARRELEAAQNELRLMLTATQEAVLVGLGYLE